MKYCDIVIHKTMVFILVDIEQPLGYCNQGCFGHHYLNLILERRGCYKHKCNISKRNKMPQNLILEVENSYVWGDRFHGTIPTLIQ